MDSKIILLNVTTESYDFQNLRFRSENQVVCILIFIFGSLSALLATVVCDSV